MNTHPNAAVVAAIGKRYAEWRMEQEPESVTDQVYRPIVDHGESYRVAIENMMAAIKADDGVSMKKYFDEAAYHEQMQRQAGVRARQYFIGKVQAQP